MVDIKSYVVLYIHHLYIFGECFEYMFYTFGFREYLMLWFMDIPQVMGIRAADDIAFLKVRMFPPESVQVLKIMEFRAGKCTLWRHESQIGDQACGGFIHMCRIGDATVGLYERKYFVKGDGCGVDEQVFFRPDDFIRFVHDLLFPEDILPVWDGHEPVIYKRVKRERVFERGEEADHMDFLLSRQFHTGDHGDAVIISMKNSGRAVGAGVVVCQRDHVQPLYGRHTD